MKIKLLTFLLLSLTIGALQAQVPNGGFENWTNVLGMFDDPDGYVSDNIEGIPGSISCEQSTDVHSGAYSVKLITKMTAGGAIQDGGIISGSINLATFGVTIGFPYTNRPTTFAGYYKHLPAVAGDSSVLSLEFTRGSLTGGDFELVGTAIFETTTTVADWTLFEADIFWLLTGNPDSAIIAGQASYGTLGSVLFLDDLSFVADGSAVDFINSNSGVMVFPNPANEALHIACGSDLMDTHFVLTNVEGTSILSENISSNQATISTNDLPDGIYLVQVYSSVDQLLSTDRIIITH